MIIPDYDHHLKCHPRTPAPTVSGISAGVWRSPGGELALIYRLSGDMVRLRVPAPQAQSRADGLWQHTCFEAFVALAGSPAYREFNFSPSGQWAAYAFSSYRRPETNDAAAAIEARPRIDARVSAGRLELSVVIAAGALPAGAARAPLEIGLAAVVESADTVDGDRSYWALHHPAPAPDFHHHNGFVISLPPPAGAADATDDARTSG